MKRKQKRERIRVRKCGLLPPELWLTRAGGWTEVYGDAAIFSSDSAVDKFLAAHGIRERDIGTF